MFSLKYDEVFVHTGNILKMGDIKLKTGSKSSDELLVALKDTLENGTYEESEKVLKITNLDILYEADPKELVTSVKVFLKTPSKEALRNAVEQVLKTLENLTIDSLIIWYPETMIEEPSTKLLDIWSVLEEYVREGRVKNLGIADLDTKVFVSLYNQVKEKPSIFHLTVQNCCVVPVDLQEFSREHEIQLLTHNDPPDILPEESIMEQFKNLNVYWIARYHSHVKCRGVLVSKGYLLSFQA